MMRVDHASGQVVLLFSLMMRRRFNLRLKLNAYLLYVTSISFGHVYSQCPTKEIWPRQRGHTTEFEKSQTMEEVQAEEAPNSVGLGGLENTG